MKSDESKRGVALVVVVCFTLMATILSAVILTASASQSRVAMRQLNVEKAMFVAEAGLERAAQYISDQKGYLGSVTTANSTVGEGNYDYTIAKTAWRTYSIRSVGTVNGVKRQVTIARAYMPTYAQYALWMDVNGVIYFIGGEVFNGHVHSNDKMWFASQNGVGPVFHEIASTLQPDYGGSLNNVIFDKGFLMNQSEGQLADVDFNSGASTSLKSLANSYGLVLDGQTSIKFQGDTVKITNERMGWTDHDYTLGQDEMIYVKNSTTGNSATKPGRVDLLGGSVDGRLTIATEDDIQINNHITYTHDPRIEPSDNALGLIAKDDVWVTTTAPNNVKVHAAILATGQYDNNDGSFGVLNYNTGSTRGALNLLGSIVQEVRGAVGTFNSSGPATGYYKSYAFDTRFATNAPPYYPVVSEKIKFAGWSEGPSS